jgi:hypothetical protein
MVRTAMVFGFLGMVAVPVCAEENQDVGSTQSGRLGFKSCGENKQKSRVSCAVSNHSRRERRGPRFRGLNFRINRREA